MYGVVKRVAGIVLALAVCVGGVSLAVVALPLASYEQRGVDTDATEASVVSVTSREIDLASAATVVVEWSGDRLVRLPAVSGLVSSVSVGPGVEVVCAQEVLRVAGRVLMAYCGPSPLFRDVSSRSRGADAAEFVDFLQQVGLLADGEVTSSQVDRVIRDVQAFVGWRVNGVVTPADFVWIGAPFVPSDVLVEAGMTVSDGTDVMQVAPGLVSATVTVGSGPRPADGSESALVFALDSSATTYPLGADGTVADLGALEGELRSRPTDGELPVSAVGSVRLAEPILASTVPATALVSGAAGECVRVRDTDGERVVPVTVLGSSIGVVYVDGAIADGDQVVVAPDGSSGC